MTKTKSKSSSRPMSSTRSPIVWPFILSIVCCCLCCCVLPIVLFFLIEAEGKTKKVLEGSSKDEETSLKNWQFYTMIGVLVILCICCMYFASRAGDCIRNYESSLGQSVPFMWKIL